MIIIKSLNELNKLMGLALIQKPDQIGETITVKNQTITLQGTEKIEVLGKDNDCRVAEAIDSGVMPNERDYICDKTTRLVLKIVINEQTVNLPDLPMAFTAKGWVVVNYINIPLIGTKT